MNLLWVMSMIDSINLCAVMLCTVVISNSLDAIFTECHWGKIIATTLKLNIPNATKAATLNELQKT